MAGVDAPGGAESQAETAERLRHGSSFGAAAAAYAEHRPGYAEAAVRWVLEPVRSRRPLRVLDLGAGTGKPGRRPAGQLVMPMVTAVLRARRK